MRIENVHTYLFAKQTDRITCPNKQIKKRMSMYLHQHSMSVRRFPVMSAGT